MGSVMCRKDFQPVAPSSCPASYSSSGIDCRPLYNSTTLNGMPSQMLTMITAIRAVSELFSHGIGSETRPMPDRNSFSAPLSCSRIQRHTAAATIIGSNHGSRSRERRNPESGNGDRKRSEEHTSELQSRGHLVCRLLLE